MTVIGPVDIKAPKTRDRGGQGSHFRSELLPPYIKRTKSVETVLPWLYLKGISTGDFSEALAALLGKDDRRLTGLIKQSWLESGRVYGYRKIHDDLRSQGESCCPNRVARLARHSGVKAQVGYKKKPGSYGGKPAVVATSQLKQSFDALAPDQVWVTDITYIRTYELVIGWSMQPRMQMDLVLSTLLMAVWRRKPKSKVVIHSDQGSQFTSLEWQAFLKTHNLEASMSRRGNYYENAVAESFFHLLKSERIRRKTYATREETRQDVFNYI